MRDRYNRGGSDGSFERVKKGKKRKNEFLSREGREQLSSNSWERKHRVQHQCVSGFEKKEKVIHMQDKEISDMIDILRNI